MAGAAQNGDAGRGLDYNEEFTVLTGFNTDIRHSERVYHVQTEDRGPANPIIESLVYVGGEILLSKKSPYDEHVHGDKVDEKAVREMMDIQHRRILEAIRRGRLESKKPGEAALDFGEETFPSPAGVSPAAVAAVAAILSAPVEPLPGDEKARATAKERSGVRSGAGPAGSRPAGRPLSGVSPKQVPIPAHTPRPLPRPSDGAGTPAVRAKTSSADNPDVYVETFVSSGPPPAAPASPRPASRGSEAVPAPPKAAAPARPASTPALPPPARPPAPPFPSAIAPAVKLQAPTLFPAPPSSVSPAVGGAKTLDQVIVDYLASEAASERLELSIMAGGEFVSGETVPVTVVATTTLSRKPVPGAQVTIRVVSTSGPPQVLFRGLTGNDGLVKASCALPEIGGGNAALIIVGFSPIGSSEAKYLIRKKGT